MKTLILVLSALVACAITTSSATAGSQEDLLKALPLNKKLAKT